jgi:hypothetical protein
MVSGEKLDAPAQFFLSKKLDAPAQFFLSKKLDAPAQFFLSKKLKCFFSHYPHLNEHFNTNGRS